MDTSVWAPRHSLCEAVLNLRRALPVTDSDDKLNNLRGRPSIRRLLEAVRLELGEIDSAKESAVRQNNPHVQEDRSLPSLVKRLFREILWVSDTVVHTLNTAMDPVIRAAVQSSNAYVLDKGSQTTVAQAF